MLRFGRAAVRLWGTDPGSSEAHLCNQQPIDLSSCCPIISWVNPAYPLPAVPLSLSLISNGLTVVDTNGFITHFAPAESASSHALLDSSPVLVELLQSPTSFLLSSFVDTHLHAPQYLNAGRALDRPLMDWLDHYTFPSERAIDADPALAERVYSRLVDRLLQNGTTAVSFFGTIGIESNMILARLCQAKGLRGQVGKVNMDINSPDDYSESTERSLAATRQFIEQMRSLVQDLPEHERLVEAVVTPRFIPTCSATLMSGLAAIAKEYGCRIQSHLSESADEVAFTKSLWKGKGDIEVFKEIGILGSRTLMAHCTHSLPDLPELARTQTSVAHCPLSNIYFSPEATFPLVEAWEHGVDVGLGSDISGGYRVDLAEQMRQAVNVSKLRRQAASQDGKPTDINWRQSVYLATLGGARALGLACGTFEVGRPFDAQLIDVDGGAIDLWNEFRTETLEDVVERWWCNGTVQDRKKVWVQGKQVYPVQS